jgi:hypothetical protein
MCKVASVSFQSLYGKAGQAALPVACPDDGDVGIFPSCFQNVQGLFDSPGPE